MKNFLTAFTVFMIWSVFGLWVYSWVRQESSTAKAEIEIPIFEKIQNPEQKEKMINLENKFFIIILFFGHYDRSLYFHY